MDGIRCDTCLVEKTAGIEHDAGEAVHVVFGQSDFRLAPLSSKAWRAEIPCSDVAPQRYRKRAGTFLATSSPLLIMHSVNQINGNSPRDQALPDRTLSIVATLYLCLLKTPKDRERLEIFASPPYRRGHDHDSFHRRFHTRLPASSPGICTDRQAKDPGE